MSLTGPANDSEWAEEAPDLWTKSWAVVGDRAKQEGRLRGSLILSRRILRANDGYRGPHQLYSYQVL